MERPLRVRLLSIVAAGLLALAGAGCGGDDEESDTGGAGTSAGETSGGGSLEPETSTAPVAEGCRDVEAPEPRPDGGERRPREPLPGGAEPELRVKTSCGSFTIALDPERAPQTTASMVALARNDFYDGTVFHRIVPDFVIQGGDPTGTGAGGPGYTTEDPPPQDQVYTRGVVAMAKGTGEPPGAAGSQFFVVTGQEAPLPPEYAVVGEVTAGLDVVDRIGALGDPVTEQPTQIVVIEDVTVSGL